MATERIAAPFLDVLRASGQLAPAQLAELAECPEASDPTPTPLARAVLQRGWLTRFQLKVIAAGKARDLSVGPYVLLDQLGEGAMGMVYKARHQHMQRIVALKVIRKERLASAVAIQRFYREVQVAASLQHPHIVLAYDAGQAGNTHYFAMEYVEGIDLARLVKEQGKLPLAQACEYVRQAALGLQHVHEKGLVHRDVKPANLLVSRTPEKTDIAARAGAATSPGDLVKLLDMGLARLQGDGDTGVTRLGAILGTPDYLAPEQALNSRAADIRADLYSLGCTLYYLLTGRPPFTGTVVTEVLVKHQTEKPTTLAENNVAVPVPVQDILDRLMAKQPDDRYQTPAELIADITPFCCAGQLAGNVFRFDDSDEADDDDSEWGTIDNGEKGKKKAGSRPSTLSRTSAEPQEVRGKRQEADAGARMKRRLLPIGGASGGIALLVLLVMVFVLAQRRAKPEPQAKGSQSPEPTAKKPEAPPDKGQPQEGEKPIVRPPGGGEKAGPMGKVVAGRLAVPVGDESGVVALAPGGKRAVVGAQTLRLWDLTTNKQLHAFGGKRFESIRCVAWSSDGHRVLLGGAAGPKQSMLTLFEAESGKVVRDFTDVEDGVGAIALSPDGRHVFSADYTAVRRWEVATGKEVSRYEGIVLPHALATAPDGRSVFAGSSQAMKAFIWSVDEKKGRDIDFHGARETPAFSPDGRAVAVSIGWQWLVYDLTTGQERGRSETLPAGVGCLAWSGDGRILVVGGVKNPGAGDDAAVYVTDATTGKILQTFEGHSSRVRSVSTSADGRRVLSSGNGVYLWEWGDAKGPPK